MKLNLKDIHQKRKITLVLLPMLTLVGCFDVDVTQRTVSTHKPEDQPKPAVTQPKEFSKADEQLISQLKDDKGFYRSLFETSYEQAKLVGTKLNEAEWAKFVNNSNDQFSVLFKGLEGREKAQVVYANSAWFSFAERNLSRYYTFVGTVIPRETDEDNLFYISIMNESYKQSIETGYSQSKTEWQDLVAKQGDEIEKILEQHGADHRAKAELIIAYNVWNEVEGRNLAVSELLTSFKDAKNNGFTGDLSHWLKVLTKNDPIENNGQAWAFIAAGFMGAKAWNGLFSPQENHLTRKYYGEDDSYRGSGGGGAVFNSHIRNGSQFNSIRNTTNNTVRGVSISRGGFGGVARGGAGG